MCQSGFVLRVTVGVTTRLWICASLSRRDETNNHIVAEEVVAAPETQVQQYADLEVSVRHVQGPAEIRQDPVPSTWGPMILRDQSVLVGA